MNECKICSKDIKKDSQYINGNYYHNECIEKLEHNWNELKKYIGSEWYCFDNESVEYDVAKDILNKMQELEEVSNE